MKVNINEKLVKISDHWNPRIVAELNGQHVKVVKFQGEFPWHKHEVEDELFFVIKGEFEMQFRDKSESIKENELIVVPRGIEHRPVAEKEVEVMLFEPASTLNTGDQQNEFTMKNLEKL